LAALPKVNNELKIGVLSSLAKRTDVNDVAAIAALLAADDGAVARSAALALGTIGSPEAAKALADAKPNDAAKSAATDAKLSCAERLLGAGKKVEALALYKSLVGDEQPKQVRLAATRGMLACAGKQQ
jgi:thioredoxin-like negative regulator of GroEL